MYSTSRCHQCQLNCEAGRSTVNSNHCFMTASFRERLGRGSFGGLSVLKLIVFQSKSSSNAQRHQIRRQYRKRNRLRNPPAQLPVVILQRILDNEAIDIDAHCMRTRLGGTFKKSSNTRTKKKRFSSSLNVTLGYLCVQSLPEWA